MSTLYFDKNIKNEIIVLSHLQNISDGLGFFDLKGSIKELKEESKRKYIKIDSQKTEELINKFIKVKLKVYFKFTKDDFLANKLVVDKTKIYQIEDEHLKIYDNNYIHKLFEISLDCPREECSTTDIKAPRIFLPNLGPNKKGPKLPGVDLDIHVPINKDDNIKGPKIGLANLGPIINDPKLPGVDIHDHVNRDDDINRPKIGLTNIDNDIKPPKIETRIVKDPDMEIINRIIHRPKIMSDEYLYDIHPFSFYNLGNSGDPPKIEFPKKNINLETPKIETNVDIKKQKSALRILSLIELENNDLIILCKDNNYNIDIKNYNILIYRFENKEYFLFEIIRYKRRIYIQKLMKNRFLVNDEYDKGYVIYSLNNNKEYSLILKENFPKSMNEFFRIYEINQNKYILCTKAIYNTHQHIGIFEKYNIKYEYTEISTPKIMNDEPEGGVGEEVIKIRKKKDITLFEIFFCNELMLTCINEWSNSYDYDQITFKEKYSIIKFGNNLIVLDLLKSKILIRYTILFYNEEEKLVIDNFEIIKWNNINDNEFILILEGNITLFELDDKNLEIQLKILSYSYFPNLIGQNLQKINENNKFCGIQNKNHLDYTVYFY